MDRHKVQKIKCLNCGLEQNPQKNCESCKIEFASYFCSVCNLFDNEHEKYKVYHCDGCGLCRVGGRDNFYHCNKCDHCIRIEAKDSHNCVSLKQDCPVCMQDMQDSRMTVYILDCGHPMHTECLENYIINQLACPICKKSIINPLEYEASMDMKVAETPMPLEYKDVKMKIICNDCLTKSIVPFHVFGGKCMRQTCRSYNTTRIDKGDEELGEEGIVQENSALD